MLQRLVLKMLAYLIDVVGHPGPQKHHRQELGGVKKGGQGEKRRRVDMWRVDVRRDQERQRKGHAKKDTM